MEVPEMIAMLREEPDSCRHGIPHRVQLSLSFVAMMRQTGVHPAYEGGPAVERSPLPEERGAYAAALDCLRTYFNGEQFLTAKEKAIPGSPGDEPPTAGTTATAPDPTPTDGSSAGGKRPKVPAGVRNR